MLSETVPAYRLATFRVAIAVLTLFAYVPHFEGLIRDYCASSFHVPIFFGIPPLSLKAGRLLIVLAHASGWALVLGFFPRLSATLLAASGFYIFSLDVQYYANNVLFHLLLLVLLACSCDRISLRTLMRGDDGKAVCTAWPEHLIRWQLSIVLFYSALDKVFSPFWSGAGGWLGEMGISPHGPLFFWLDRANETFLSLWEVGIKRAVIGLELFLAVAFLLKPLRRLVVPLGLFFAIYLEVLVRPQLFAWDMVAVLLLFLPAADRQYTVSYDKENAVLSLSHRLISRFDWLRRLTWNPASGKGFSLADALFLFPGPLFVFFVVVRFGHFWGYPLLGFSAHDLVFLMMVALLSLWLGARVFFGRWRFGRS